MLDKRSEFKSDIRLQQFEIRYEHPVVFTRDSFHPGNSVFLDVLALREPEKRHRCLFFVDDGVLSILPDLPSRIQAYASAHEPHMELAGVVPIPGGESCKNDAGVLPWLIELLHQSKIDRHSFVIAIGGGAVLDAAGFACAIFHRGVRHIRFPTTVLSQDDSGVGVKNALNWRGQKNLIGAFAPPWAIVNDSLFLDALPDREKRAGMAEAIKVALIRDGAFFDWIEANASALVEFSPGLLDTLIERSAELHMRQIRSGGDPFETGSARPLDFGHWSAHKLEQLTRHAVNHGEAVAIGIAIDARYSVLSGLLAEGQDLRVLRLLQRLGFPLWRDELTQEDDQGGWSLLHGLTEFQEHLGGELTITLLSGIGRGVEVNHLDPALIRKSVAWLERRADPCA